MKECSIIVIGGGHAGIEAALASARMGVPTLLLTLRLDTIGHMSCNPAIGGVGKGQLVKEIDALGGEMAKAADACGIQFRTLNASKGPAVQSSRAQIDRALYKNYMKKAILGQKNLKVKEAQVSRLLVKNRQIYGVATESAEEISAETVVICSGTFLNGLIHVGLTHYPGGRVAEQSAIDLDTSLRDLGLDLLRFKTGTCPRLDKNTIDYSQLIVQEGDQPPKPFSFSTKKLIRKQVPCHITYTNKKTHQIILDNLDKSPLYAGVIKATGVRYCPSVEDKIVKFADKERHQVFLEPEGLNTNQVYPNGISTSLPEEVQLQIVHSIAGLEDAKILQFGYGIEHTVVEPTQLYPTLETKPIRNLFLAGQINGTTGYEEAAAQGLIAGINAALRVQGKEQFILDRSTSYIGVLIDDLVTKGTAEPYRMFTSRVEYRLIIREDNADLRLRKKGYGLGLVSKKEFEQTSKNAQDTEKTIVSLQKTFLKPGQQLNTALEELGTAALRKKTSLAELLKRPQLDLHKLAGLPGVRLDIPEVVAQQAEIAVKYEGFVRRQLAEVERFKNLEKIKLPADLDYAEIPGLSREIREKLKRVKPITLGQASRISGVTPAAVAILMVWLRKLSGERK